MSSIYISSILAKIYFIKVNLECFRYFVSYKFYTDMTFFILLTICVVESFLNKILKFCIRPLIIAEIVIGNFSRKIIQNHLHFMEYK